MKRLLYILLLSLLTVNVGKVKIICNNDRLRTPLNYSKNRKTINFYNWVDYISNDVIKCFEKLSNIKVMINYTNNDNMTRTKLMSGFSGFNVIEQGSLYLESEINAKSLNKLRKEKLPNWKYRNKVIYHKISENDSKNRYAIIYSYGTTGIAYNQNMVNKALKNSKGDKVIPNSWKYIFDEKYLKPLSKCGISFLDEAEQVFGNYFHYKGIDPNSTRKEDYRDAVEYLIHNVRPYIKYFDSNKYQGDFISGNICLSMGYSGDLTRSIKKAEFINPKEKLFYVIPKEGTNIWFDILAIPKDSNNIESTHKFLNFTMDPYIMAVNSNYLYQPNISHNEKYLNEIFLNKNINPGDKQIKKMYVLKMHSSNFQGFVNRMWMYVKYGIHTKSCLN